MTRESVVATARSLLAPPGSRRPAVRWRHQGRDPATGLDCGGLVVWVAHELGHKVDVDCRAYERYPDGVSLRAWMGEHLHRKAPGTRGAEPGDVFLLRDAGLRHPLHVALVMPGRDRSLNVLHAWARARGVVEHPLPADWSFEVAGTYCYRPLAGVPWCWHE